MSQSVAGELELARNALADEYDVLDEIGRGGMAIVFRARDKALDRDVAIKVLPPAMAFDAAFVERFQREARTAAQLEHPNIVPIYRVGQAGVGPSQVIYIVMKQLRGESLASLLAARGTLPPEEIRAVLRDTAQALAYASRPLGSRRLRDRQVHGGALPHAERHGRGHTALHESGASAG
jgi:serine/threonine protein kinase